MSTLACRRQIPRASEPIPEMDLDLGEIRRDYTSARGHDAAAKIDRARGERRIRAALARGVAVPILAELAGLSRQRINQVRYSTPTMEDGHDGTSNGST